MDPGHADDASNVDVPVPVGLSDDSSNDVAFVDADATQAMHDMDVEQSTVTAGLAEGVPLWTEAAPAPPASSCPASGPPSGSVPGAPAQHELASQDGHSDELTAQDVATELNKHIGHTNLQLSKLSVEVQRCFDANSTRLRRLENDQDANNQTFDGIATSFDNAEHRTHLAKERIDKHDAQISCLNGAFRSLAHNTAKDVLRIEATVAEAKLNDSNSAVLKLTSKIDNIDDYISATVRAQNR